MKYDEVSVSNVAPLSKFVKPAIISSENLYSLDYVVSWLQCMEYILYTSTYTS